MLGLLRFHPKKKKKKILRLSSVEYGFKPNKMLMLKNIHPSHDLILMIPALFFIIFFIIVDIIYCV